MASGRKGGSSRPSRKPRAAKRPAPGIAEPEATSEEGRAPQNDFPIVGVGASAGGLEAFKQLLAALPDDTGMAYVLVQHLDPRHESIMAELLAKGCRMPVSEIREDTAVAPNHVYVAPGKHDVTIGSGLLRLVPRTNTRGQHMPIDSFLRTLAEAQGTRAIGVILSGTASDGTLGLKAIKAEGGIAFAQDPDSAAYDGMPRSAMASGCVDFVLPPGLIAKELSRLSRHPYVNTTPHEGLEQSAVAPSGKGGMKAILTLVRRASGVDFSAYKEATIQRRVARRMALVRVLKLEDYLRHLAGHPDEVHALFQDCLITVTSFFRDPTTFQILRDQVLPSLLKDRPPETPLRVWVPGCATGEEVYSIVICLLEQAGGFPGSSPAFQVFATDLSEAALGKARAGKYAESIAQDVSPPRLARFFSRVNGQYQISKAIRDMCVFARHDLTRDPPFGRLDLISCRNVLIYLGPQLQQRVLATFHYALKPSGVLLLGASEAMGGSSELFASTDKKHRIYAKRPTSSPAAPGFARGGGAESVGPSRRAGQTVAAEAPSREADRLLLARYAPVSVIVDRRDAIVEFRGEIDLYLEHTPGRASLDLFKMARKGLPLGLRQALQEARKKDAPVRKTGLTVLRRGQLHRLDLEVIPLKGSRENEGSLLVLFDARSDRSGGQARAEGRRPPARLETSENAKLRQELAEATRYLQTVMQEHEAASEEAQASSEEILSANEELQSVNEELETAKEEMESSNEELATLNQEVRERNLELGHALDFANGIVETVRNPLLLLNAELRVERANRAFREHFQVSAEDCVGRRLYDLGNGQWNVPELREALARVLSEGALEGFEVEHDFPHLGPRTLVLNARKLRHDSVQESIVLAFEDRTEARKAGTERDALLEREQIARRQAEQADRIKDEFVATLSHELRGPLNAMVGWVHVLKESGIDDATRERGRAAIERGVHTQSRLIEELLDYSRTVAGKLSLAQRLVDVVPVAQAAVDAIRTATEAKQIFLELVREPGPAIVLGDPDRLQQVLWNVLSNAVKFTPRQGRVTLWIGRVGTDLHIRVSDTGHGISAEFLPHVFERFRQQEGARSRTQSGLGLGLSIAKQLVELHGGTIGADSAGPDRGATITVTLPIPPLLMEPKGATEADVPQEPTASERAWEETERTTLSGVRVLVVEDDPDGREMLVTAFEHCGAQVSEAASAPEAMETFRRAMPDVVVSDIGLPGEDGYALMARIRGLSAADGGRVPALALTAYAGAEDRRKALAAGFHMHVPKPADPAALVAKVAALAARGDGGR